MGPYRHAMGIWTRLTLRRSSESTAMSDLARIRLRTRCVKTMVRMERTLSTYTNVGAFFSRVVGKPLCRSASPQRKTDTFARSRTGRKGPFAAYYVQIAPHGKSFVGESFACYVYS